MSGSSLDGLDICYSTISGNNSHYSYEILQGETIIYPPEIFKKLQQCRTLTSLELLTLDIELGRFFGNTCVDFIAKYNIPHLDFIASHGHTVFHFPLKNISLQIGSGQMISAISGVKTLCSLRSNDIAHGGQGAPIVPIGDVLFFPDYTYCLNLGGIMNISIKNSENIISFDIGSCNQVLNHLANRLGKEYDKDGIFASQGRLHLALFEELNQVGYFLTSPPKSLDNDFSNQLLSIIDLYIHNTSVSIEDALHTFSHHIAFQISRYVEPNHPILCTGGGSHNLFLIHLLQSQYHLEVKLPDDNLINYKEALVMSLMGVRYFQNKYNVLQSVTGASQDTINGVLYLP